MGHILPFTIDHSQIEPLFYSLHSTSCRLSLLFLTKFYFVSHLKERVEKICLNCKAELSGRFCHNCGQENIEPKESAWHLVTHFFNDITHFDGKFFSSTGLLIRKPGFLPRQYMLGRRASYLNPIRMYIFSSAVFFLFFFTVFHLAEKGIDRSTTIEGKSIEEIRSLLPDSLKAFTTRINQGKPVAKDALEPFLDSLKNVGGFHFTSRKYGSKREYDSLLANGVKKHNWLERKLIYKELEINEKYHNRGGDALKSLSSIFLHSLPQMLFISLPFFALMLKLLYRRQKEYYYVSHGIFSIHFYIFIFIVFLSILTVGKIREMTHWEWIRYLEWLLRFSIFFYLYKAMRNFYLQSRAKTIIKFMLLTFSSVLLLFVLFAVFIIFSLMKI